jgi:hypothetical protein
MWTEENRDCVFIYQEHELIDINSDPKEEYTYTLGIQTEWQLQMMAYHGHKSAVSFDATFGTNAPRVPSTPVPFCFFSFSAPPVLTFHIFRTSHVDLGVLYCAKYSLYTVIVFDQWQNGIPVAFIVTSRCAEEDILLWLTKLRDRVLEFKPDRHPNAVIVDYAKVELNCIS